METFAQELVLRLEWLADRLEKWLDAHLLDILIILVGAWIFRRAANEIINRILKHIVRPDYYPTKNDREKRIKTLHNLAYGVIRLGVYVIATLLIVGELWPGARTAIFTSAGVLGVIIGFGAQNLIKDVVTGVFIIMENQYRIGDEVLLHAGMGLGNVDGVVEDVTIRTTVLRDLNGNVHHIPNGNVGLTTNKTLGYSRMNEILIVPYETDLDKLEKIIKQVGENMSELSEIKSKILEPPQMVSVRGFTEQGIKVRILAKTSAASQWKLRSLFFRRLQKELAKNKIKIVGHEDTELTS